MRLLLPVAVLLAGFAAPPPDTADDLFALTIETGRFAVMMDQAGEALRHVPRAGEELSDEATQRAYAHRMLVASVARAHALRAEACGRGVLAGELCAPYLPSWLGESLAEPPAQDALRAMTGEAAPHVIALWDALCAKAADAGADEYLCAIE